MKVATLLLARLLYVGSRAGPVGWVGVGAMLLALAMFGASHLQLDPGNRAAIEDIAQLQAQIARASAPGAALRNPTDAMAAVAGQLPAADQVPVFIQDVQNRASRGGVQIERTEYRMQSALGNRALQLQLVLPAHGTYPQLRTWLESLLHDHPSAALDELSLRREHDGTAQLEARVIFSFYSQAVR
jgi:hypothetical protein